MPGEATPARPRASRHEPAPTAAQCQRGRSTPRESRRCIRTQTLAPAAQARGAEPSSTTAREHQAELSKPLPCRAVQNLQRKRRPFPPAPGPRHPLTAAARHNHSALPSSHGEGDAEHGPGPWEGSRKEEFTFCSYMPVAEALEEPGTLRKPLLGGWMGAASTPAPAAAPARPSACAKVGPRVEAPALLTQGRPGNVCWAWSSPGSLLAPARLTRHWDPQGCCLGIPWFQPRVPERGDLSHLCSKTCLEKPCPQPKGSAVVWQAGAQQLSSTGKRLEPQQREGLCSLLPGLQSCITQGQREQHCLGMHCGLCLRASPYFLPLHPLTLQPDLLEHPPPAPNFQRCISA